VYQASKQYFSVTHQAIFLANPDGSGIVQDFTALKEYMVDATHTCSSYCPLNAEDAPLAPLGYGENATDEGSTTILGHQVEDIFWRVAIPILNLTVQESHLYTDISGNYSRADAAPVLETDSIGFGSEQLIHQNTSYDSFKGGAQDPSLFVVKGNATCPLDNNCPSDDDSQGNDNMPQNSIDMPAEFGAASFPGAAQSRLLRATYKSPEHARRLFAAAEGMRSAVGASGSLEAFVDEAMAGMSTRAHGLRASREQVRAVVAGAIGAEL